MPLELVADDTHDHSRCTHTPEQDKAIFLFSWEVVIVYVIECVHINPQANWKDHELELQEFLLACKQKGSMADMRRLEIFQKPKIKIDSTTVGLQMMEDIHDAFRDPYQGDGHDVLLAMMDHYRKSERSGAAGKSKPYNYSIAMVQSSGMGKSRTVDMAAQKRFAFLLNLRDPGAEGQLSYPPADVNVREFFKALEILDDSDIQRQLGAFLTAVFRKAKEQVERYRTSTADSIARWWHTWMQEGNFADRVGTRRAKFYAEAIEYAGEILISEDFASKAHVLLRASCQNLLETLEIAQRKDLPATAVKFFISIDEAHVMTVKPVGKRTRTVYQILGTVLTWLNEQPVFTIFLSTNSRLQELAAPPDLQPSLRAAKGSTLFPPITELPFDTFATGLYTRLKEKSPRKPVSLDSVCNLDVIARFGRPLWYSLYKHAYTQEDSIIGFAKLKLDGTSMKDGQSLAVNLACLSVRIMLDFDSARESGRTAVSDLVESHMRVVFAVPEHRKFMRTGTPSEPILAETAARILNTNPSGEMQLLIDTLAPGILAQSLQGGLLARGERGEMVTRLLWTIAHDKAIQSLYKMDLSEGYLRFHRPIAVIEFLKALFHKDYHEVILNAKPVGDSEGPSLQEAFKDAYLNFTHFSLAADSEVIQVSQIFRLLLRGTAIQCRNNQESIDHVAPILFGDPAVTEIRQDATSTMQGQTKNRKNPQNDLQISPTITRPNGDLPVLSLQHELGASYSGVRYVERNTYNLRKNSKGLNAHKRHYHIVAYGASSATYAAIPPSADGIYAALLASTHVIDDFPRAILPGSVKMLDQMLPALQYAENGFTWF